MRRTTSILLTLLLTLLSGSLLSQQTYHTGIGLRGGYPSGISGKFFINPSNAVEGVLSFGWGAIGVTGLYQIHVPMAEVPGLNLYYGGGAHAAIIETNKNTPWGESSAKLALGVDGVVGAEYVIKEIPISISLDLIPLINILPSVRPYLQAGLSIRYVIK